jgi:adenosylcobyric acid synthase
LHGLFASDGFRSEVLTMLGTQSQLTSYDAAVEDTLDQLAAFIEQHLNVDALIALARPVAP